MKLDREPVECLRVRAALGAWVDGALGEEAALVDRHLADCDACRAEAGLLRWVSRAVQGLPRVEPDPDLRRRMLAQVAEEARYERTHVLERRFEDRQISFRHEMENAGSGPWRPSEEEFPAGGASLVWWQRQESRLGSTGHRVSEFVEWRHLE